MKYLRVQELVSQACREIEYLEWLYNTMTLQNHLKCTEIYKNRVDLTYKTLNAMTKEMTLVPSNMQYNLRKAKQALLEGFWLITNDFNKRSHELCKLEANNEILSLILDNK